MVNGVVIPCWNIYHIGPSVYSTAAGFIDEHRATGNRTKVKGKPPIGLIEAQHTASKFDVQRDCFLLCARELVVMNEFSNSFQFPITYRFM